MKRIYIVKANSYKDALKKVKDSEFSEEDFENRLVDLYNILVSVLKDSDKAKTQMKEIYNSNPWEWSTEEEDVWIDFLKNL